jgi:predicted ATP-binding protein involved in virulence
MGKRTIDRLDEKTQDENEIKKIENPLNNLRALIILKRDEVELNSYPKSLPFGRYYDIEKLGYLESIYNTLRDLKERVEILEKKD